MKTLADLKRALLVGTKITLIEAPDMPSHKYLNVPRYVVKAQSNGVMLAIDPTEKRGSFMDLPRASLVEFEGDTIRIYNVGHRPLTQAEQSILANMPSSRAENKEQIEQDALCDGSSMYYKDKHYLKQANAEYLSGHETVRGLRYDWNRKDVYDETIKGTVQLVYKLS